MAKPSANNTHRREPYKLTRERLEEIAKLVSLGVPGESAAASKGVSRSSYYAWRKYGKTHPDSPEGKFRKAIDDAKGTLQIRLVGSLTAAAAKGDVRAITFMLAQRFPEKWGQRRLELSGKKGKPLEVQHQAVVYVPEMVPDGSDSSEPGGMGEAGEA